MTDEEVLTAIIDDPDANPTDAAFGKDARVAMLRRSERGHQTGINAILRAYMNAHADDR
jgi:hypothetical protein